MKRFSWHTLLGFSLVLSSALLYLFHFAVFKDLNHILIYLVGDIAFLPLEVLLVTLILHRLLSEREKRTLLQKMNMVIGVFFSEVGTGLLKSLSEFDSRTEQFRSHLIIQNSWSEKDFIETCKSVHNYEYKMESRKGDLESLRSFLLEKRAFLLRLLENPNLLEHESFTELLWAVFHLTEELSLRLHVRQLSRADYEHLSVDMKRAYILLISEWLKYMRHLKQDYPYLFSLALRTNPFDPSASPEIK